MDHQYHVVSPFHLQCQTPSFGDPWPSHFWTCWRGCRGIPTPINKCVSADELFPLIQLLIICTCVYHLTYYRMRISRHIWLHPTIVMPSLYPCLVTPIIFHCTCLTNLSFLSDCQRQILLQITHIIWLSGPALYICHSLFVLSCLIPIIMCMCAYIYIYIYNINYIYIYIYLHTIMDWYTPTSMSGLMWSGAQGHHRPPLTSGSGTGLQVAVWRLTWNPKLHSRAAKASTNRKQ